MKRIIALFALVVLLASGASSQVIFKTLMADTLYLGSTIGGTLGLYQAGDSLWGYKGSVGPINLFRSTANGTANYFGMFSAPTKLGDGGLFRYGSASAYSLVFLGGTGDTKVVLRTVDGDTAYMRVNGSFAGNTLRLGPSVYIDGTISGNGSGLTTLNASNISSGTLGSDRLPLSGASAATYYAPTLTVDTYGRITSIASGRSSLVKGSGGALSMPVWRGSDSLGTVGFMTITGSSVRIEGNNGNKWLTFYHDDAPADSATIRHTETGGLTFKDSDINQDVTLSQLANPRDNLIVTLDSADIAQLGSRTLLKWKLPRAFDVDTMFAAVQGSAGDTVAMDFRWDATHYNDPGGGTALQSTPSNIVDNTTGFTVTSFTSSTISANAWVWVRLTKKTGTPKSCIFVLRGKYIGAL